MLIFGDYHTHTIFSHGTGTIEDNVKSAIKKGLKQIAITDHGLAHPLYGITRKKLIEMRKEIDRLTPLYPEIKIYLGVEANLISLDGDVDLPEDIIDSLDIVLVGFHNFATAKNVKTFFNFYLPNWLGIKTQKRIELNTQAYINMMDKYPCIDCITHLNYGCKVNAARIAEKAKQENVYIELNGKRTLFSDFDIYKMVKNNTKFLINSDAHKSYRVGRPTLSMNFAIKHKIPKTLLCNVDKIPNFKKVNIKE